MIFKRKELNTIYLFMSKEKFKGIKSIIRSRFNKELTRISAEVGEELQELQKNGASKQEMDEYISSDYIYDDLNERMEMLKLFYDAVMNTEMEFSCDTEITHIGYERLHEIANTIKFSN